jgi:hypothetical protein
MSDSYDHKIFYIKTGDLRPKLEIHFVDCDGEALDLGPYQSLKVHIAACIGGRKIVTGGLMVVEDPAVDGKATYEWQTGETDEAGDYLIEVVCELDHDDDDSNNDGIKDVGGGAATATKPMTLPSGGYGKMTILPRL